VFSVFAAKIFTGATPQRLTLITLIPITLGVILSALTEINFNLIGFLAAALSTFSYVFQMHFTKRSLQKLDIEPVVFHMYTSIVALILVGPYTVYYELVPLWSGGQDLVSPSPQEGSASRGTLLILIFMSLASHYIQNVASIYVLHGVEVLSHQVAGTLKRLLVIVLSIVYFHNPVTWFNSFGICLALAGFFSYGLLPHDRSTEKGATEMSRRNSKVADFDLEKQT